MLTPCRTTPVVPSFSACPGAASFIVLLVMSGIIALAAPAFHLLSIRKQMGKEPVSLTGAMMLVQNVLNVMDSYLR